MLSALALALADCALPSQLRDGAGARKSIALEVRGTHPPPQKKTITSPAMTPGCVSASAWL
jgi:hypothetical protein